MRIERKEIVKVQLQDGDIHFVPLYTYPGDMELAKKAQAELEKKGINVSENPVCSVSFGRGARAS